MSGVVELLCSRRAPQVAVLALMSIGFAGCSADMQTRLSQDPFSNPFASQAEATGSVPTPAVEHRELPQYSRPPSQYQAAALPPPVAAPRSLPAPTAGMSGGGRGVASYSPPPAHPLETTGTVAPRSVASAHAGGQGSTTIIVGTSDTLEMLAHRYNVSPAAIMQANGYRGPRVLSPGQQLIIPRQSTAMAEPALAVPAVHVVNRGDTLLSIAHRNHIPVAELARANGLAPTATLKLGMKLTVPGAKTAAVAPGTPALPPMAAAQPAAAATVSANRMAAAGPESQQKARLAQSTTTPEELSGPSPVKAAEANGALPSFRWPVRGRVITAYGAKTNGKANDGINLAVPEGTPVKAADDGVVAYSGNELKGYGNLVLIRHANGYVTAYAHASELLVKRGDTIKRGQVIAKSGQSGEVASPQLHFEIRKGSSPVDPLQFLSGA